MKIGDVELPIVSNMVESSEAEVDEIKPNNSYDFDMDSVPVKHEKKVDTLTITGFLNVEVHSQHLSLDEQKQQLNNLRKNDVEQNTFDYKSYKGHLLVEDVNVVEEGNSRIVREVELTVRYFPWPKYYGEVTWQ